MTDTWSLRDSMTAVLIGVFCFVTLWMQVLKLFFGEKIPLIAWAATFAALFALQLRYGPRDWSGLEIPKGYVGAAAGMIGLLLLESALNLQHTGIPSVQRSHQVAAFSLLGASAGLLMQLGGRPRFARAIPVVFFWLLVGEASVEFFAFNAIAGFEPSDWWFQPWGTAGNVVYTEPAWFGLRRFFGLVGWHPSMTVLTLAFLGLWLDGKSRTIRFRVTAIVMGALSLSGTAIATAFLLAGSIGWDAWQEFPLALRRRYTQAAVLVGAIAAGAYLATGMFREGKLSIAYSGFLAGMKATQLADLWRVYETADTYRRLTGLDPITIPAFPNYLVTNAGYFASTDFGAAYRWGYGGLIGLGSLALQLALCFSLGRRLLPRHQLPILVLLLVFSITHYSPWNVMVSAFALPFSAIVLATARHGQDSRRSCKKAGPPPVAIRASPAVGTPS